MRIVIDTTFICEAGLRTSYAHMSALVLVSLSKHRIVLDFDNRLLGQYEANLSHCDFYRKWYGELKKCQLIEFRSGNLPHNVESRLSDLSFHDMVDRIVVALAGRTDRSIFTEDSDFGKGPSPKAQDHIDVLSYLTQELDMNVCDGSEALRLLQMP